MNELSDGVIGAFGRLRADGPLISSSGDLDGEAPGAERGDEHPATHVGGIRLGMAWRAERHQAVEIEVRAPMGALDDVVDPRGRPSGPQTSQRQRARRKTTWVQAVDVVPSWANAGKVRTASYVEVKALSCRESWREGKEETTITEEENQVGRLAVLTHGSPEALQRWPRAWRPGEVRRRHALIGTARGRGGRRRACAVRRPRR
jgi:hypothetical protein